MEKTKFNCGTLWYYNLEPNDPITVRYVITMKDEVDGEALREALDITMRRYPYFGKRIVADKTGYALADNDKPVVLLNTDKPITLCGSEANFHQLALSYQGDTIYFNNTHALCDGRGRSAMLHTLMYYYCKLRYNEEIDMPGVNLADSPIDPAEWADPYDGPLPEPAVDLGEPIPSTLAMCLRNMGLVHPSTTQIHRIRIDEKQLMTRCKSNDATPNTAIALLMCRAIAKLHPDSTEPIKAGVYCDLRSVLKVPLTHESLVTTLDLDYAPHMRDMDFAEQNTIFRGELMLLTEDAHLLRGQKALKKLCFDINSLPSLEEKIAASKAAMSSVFKSHSFSVSYSGKSSYGSADKYIKALYPQPEAKGIGILIEITAADGWFYLTFAQEWREDVYFDAFLKEIIAHGLDFDLLYSGQSEPAGFSLK